MSENQELIMLRIHARAAEDYIRVLTEFVRNLSQADEYQSDDAGPCLFISWKEDALGLVCYMEGCLNRPGNSTPDGRAFCGNHAHVMD